MDKLGINIVGRQDHSTRIYNVGRGFCGVAAKVTFGADDSLYLVFTTDGRAYGVSVEGDLKLDAEEHSFGVTPYNVDWTSEAKSRGCGAGKVIITNPDDPADVSVFELSLSDAQTVDVKFKDKSGANARAVLTEESDAGVVDRGIQRMLADMSHHQWSGDMVAAREDWNLGDPAGLRRNILT